MTERERLEHYLDDFGARLAGTAGGAPPAPRRRARRAPALVLGGATAIAAVAVVLAASGERGLDPVAQARAALASPGEIVYMKITSTTIAPGSSSVPPPQTTEQWSALGPPRWRFVQTLPRRGAVMRSLEGGGRMIPISGRLEMSYGAGVTRSYNADRDTLVVTRGYRDGDAAARLPSVLGQGSGDPTVDLRSMLLQGTVSDRGEQRLRGRTVRRFVVEQRRDGANDPPTRRRMVYDVDPESFAPVEGRLTVTFGTRRSLPRLTSVMRVDAYRRIPLDDTSAKLLRIPTTPRTRATFDTKQSLQARFRAWRAKCRKLKNGTLACPPPPFPAPKPRTSR